MADDTANVTTPVGSAELRHLVKQNFLKTSNQLRALDVSAGCKLDSLRSNQKSENSIKRSHSKSMKKFSFYGEGIDEDVKVSHYTSVACKPSV